MGVIGGWRGFGGRASRAHHHQPPPSLHPSCLPRRELQSKVPLERLQEILGEVSAMNE